MARRRKGRDVQGVILLDKPKGLSSNQALQRVKWLFNANKAGHTGNLDPMATGMLPLCFGHATRVSAFLLDADKSYQATIKLGERTNTADADGEVVETAAVPDITLTDLERVAEEFTGPQQQIPPMYSALKHEGQRLYKLARAGEEVERPPRDITIYSIDDVALTEDGFCCTVSCSKGTYIRTLAEDMATALGTVGHLTALRRETVGSFDADLPLVTIDELAELSERQSTRDLPKAEVAAIEALEIDYSAIDAKLLPSDLPLMHWPAANLNIDAAVSILHGNPVFSSATRKEDPDALLRVYDSAERFIGIGRVLKDGRLAPYRVFAPPRVDA